MPSKLLPTEPTYSSGTTDEGEYLSVGDRKAIFKKQRVSGADFKRGSSAGSSVGEARGKKLTSKDFGTKTGKLTKILRDTRGKVLVNEKKITALELQDTKELEPAEEGGALSKGTESLIGPLKNIDSGVNSIIETLKQGNKADADAQNDARIQAEKDARDKKEGKLEGIKGKLADAAQTVLKPVQNIFQKIWDFLKTVFMGRVVMKLFEWFTDEKNKEKVASLFRFLKDWWPVLVAGIMAVVGPGMIFTAGLIALLVWGIPKIIEAVKWVGSLFGIGVDKELKNVESDADKFAKGTTKEIEKEGAVTGESGETPKAEVGDTKVPETDVTPPEVGETQQQAKDVQSGADQAEPLKMAGGGQVPGSGSGDTVPAMLTPGEFVMSKGAVQKYGSGTLAGMNAAAGGTNRPRMGGYNGGGTVKNVSNISNRGGTVKNVSNTSNRGGSIFNNTSSGISLGGPRIHYGGGGLVKNFVGSRTINVPQSISYQQPLHFAGGGSVPDGQAAKIVKSSPSQIVINPPSGPPPAEQQDPISQVDAQMNAHGLPDQELPQFNAGARRSLGKIKTLGIAV